MGQQRAMVERQDPMRPQHEFHYCHNCQRGEPGFVQPKRVGVWQCNKCSYTQIVTECTGRYCTCNR